MLWVVREAKCIAWLRQELVVVARLGCLSPSSFRISMSPGRMTPQPHHGTHGAVWDSPDRTAARVTPCTAVPHGFASGWSSSISSCVNMYTRRKQLDRLECIEHCCRVTSYNQRIGQQPLYKVQDRSLKAFTIVTTQLNTTSANCP